MKCYLPPVCYFSVGLCQRDCENWHRLFDSHSGPLKGSGPLVARLQTITREETNTRTRRTSCLYDKPPQERHMREHVGECIQRSECAQKVINSVMRCFHPWVVNIEGHGADEKDVNQQRPSGSSAHTHTHTHTHTHIYAHINKCHCAWKRQGA